MELPDGILPILAAYLPALLLGVLLGALGLYSKRGYPATSLVILFFVYRSLLDPYSDVLFNISLYKTEGWTPFSCVSVGHLVSIVPVNGCFLFVWLRRVDREWLQEHKYSTLLAGVLVAAFFGPEVLAVLQSQLLNLSVFCFDDPHAERLMLYVKLFALYEIVPQLIFQTIAMINGQGEFLFTCTSLALSVLSALLIVAKGIILAASERDGPDGVYVELPCEAPPSMLRTLDATALKGALKPWRELALRDANRGFDYLNRTDFAKAIEEEAYINGPALLLSNFSLNNLGILEQGELEAFVGNTDVGFEQFAESSKAYLQSQTCMAALGLYAWRPRSSFGQKVVLRFTSVGEKVNIGRPQSDEEANLRSIALTEESAEKSATPARLVLPGDLGVSRQHARIVFRDVEGFCFFLLTDTESTTGTELFRPSNLRSVVRGPSTEKIQWYRKVLGANAPCKFKVGDVVRFGSEAAFVFTFNYLRDGPTPFHGSRPGYPWDDEEEGFEQIRSSGSENKALLADLDVLGDDFLKLRAVYGDDAFPL